MNIPDINPLDFAEYVYKTVKELQRDARDDGGYALIRDGKIAELRKAANWAAVAIYGDNPERHRAYLRQCGF